MTQQISAATGSAQGGSTTQIQIHPHAQDRWAQRTPAEESLSAAWEASVSVQAPHANATETRLYAPYDALLIYRHGLLRTVLLNDGRLECAGLDTCAACENLIDPIEDETCRWCGERTRTQGHGGVTLTRGASE